MTHELEKFFSAPVLGITAEVKINEPLARYSFYQIGGPARVLVTPRSREDLDWTWKGISKTGAPYFIVGAGSNLLISDSGFPGVVIRAGRMNLEVIERQGVLRVGGSIMISAMLRRASQEGWSGLEFLTGIPGTIGGAVRMNAGTHLGETQSRLTRVEAVILQGDKLRDRMFSREELRFEYRKNLFLPEGAIVWSTEWEVGREDPATVKARIDEILLRRKQTQPIDRPSCGSVFKNPRESGVSAWQVIDRLGLRGHRIGNAQYSEKHSNFIVNLGGACAADVRALIALAQSRAQSELGITLQQEVIFVG